MDTFFYIVAELDGDRRFLNKNMGYDTDFENVMRFPDKEMAATFLQRRNLQAKNHRIMRAST